MVFYPLRYWSNSHLAILTICCTVFASCFGEIASLFFAVFRVTIPPMAESPLAVLVVDDEENHAARKDNRIAASLEKLGAICQIAHSQKLNRVLPCCSQIWNRRLILWYNDEHEEYATEFCL